MAPMETAFGTLARRRDVFEDRRIADRQCSDSLLEGICLYAFEGKHPFDEQGVKRIEGLESIYGLDLDASDSHGMVEGD